MICVLGLELSEAQRRLQSVGVSVLTEECRSRKGVPGADSARVIGQRMCANEATLLYASFVTVPLWPKLPRGN